MTTTAVFTETQLLAAARRIDDRHGDHLTGDQWYAKRALTSELDSIVATMPGVDVIAYANADPTYLTDAVWERSRTVINELQYLDSLAEEQRVANVEALCEQIRDELANEPADVIDRFFYHVTSWNGTLANLLTSCRLGPFRGRRGARR